MTYKEYEVFNKRWGYTARTCSETYLQLLNMHNDSAISKLLKPYPLDETGHELDETLEED